MAAACFYKRGVNMLNDNVLNLYSKSDKYYMRLMCGRSLGRELNVWDIFRNYFEHFTAMGMNLFSYDVSDYNGLDIPERFFKQLEKRYFFFGRAGIVTHGNELVAVSASGYGEDLYNEPTDFNFVFGGGIPDTSRTPEQRVIDQDGVYTKNTFTAYPTAMAAEQYALMIAHCDMSIIAELVNSRFMDLLKAGNNKSAEAAAKFHKDLYSGKLSYIYDATEELEVDRSVSRVSKLRDYVDTKSSLLKEFYALFGINKTNEKRERMITDEVKDNKELLQFNVKDMLEQREKMCDDLRDVFGVDISVKCHVDLDADGTPEAEEKEAPQEETAGGAGDEV